MSIKVTQDESTFKVEQVDRSYLGAATSVLEVTGTTVTVNGHSIASAGSVTTSMLAAGAVTKAKTAMFISTEITGTGAPQNVAHGLGVVPAAVFVAPTDLTPATVGQYSVVEGTHTTTNVVLTITLNKKAKVMAWA